MPHWRPGCLRGSGTDGEPIQYRPANTNGFPVCAEDVRDDSRTTTLVDLRKLEGCGLGLIIAGGLDKHVRPHISNLRPGGIAHRSDLLQVGDILLSVNGIKTSAMKHEEIINLLKNAEENVRLEIEYELPELVPTDVFSVGCKQHTVVLDTDSHSFGVTLRGGSCQNRIKTRPLTVTQVRPGGAADREGSMKSGDRILAVNDFSIVTLSLTEMNMLLSQCSGETSFTVEYDVSVIDTVQKATGPLLIEIDKTPGAALGLSLSHARHNGKQCVCIENIRPMSIADRCGALHIGDHILSIDGASVEHMTVAEATQLLKSSPGDNIKMEILPVRLVAKKMSTDTVFFNAGFQKTTGILPSISSPMLNNPSLFNGIGTSRSYSMLGYAGRLSTDMLAKRRKSWMKSDRKMDKRLGGSCASVASASTSVFTASNQVCRMEVCEVMLYGEPAGLGLGLESTGLPNCILQDPPMVTRLEPHTAAERCGVIQQGDRILTVNGADCCEHTLEDINQILMECWQHVRLEVEFDVADAVMASSGVFVVKLPRKPGGIGITLSAKSKLGNPILITEVKKGSTAYRCGSVQSGDKLVSINDIRTDNLSIEEAAALLKGDEEIIKLKLKRDDPCFGDHGEDLISYTVELERRGGPLGVTITGTDDPSDPIVISALVDGGLAARTGAIQVGDRVLSINGAQTTGKSLTEATTMLAEAGDLVTLKVARVDKPRSMSVGSTRTLVGRNLASKSITPVKSIDSALESWDSSGGDAHAWSHRSHRPAKKSQPSSAMVSKLKDSRKRVRPYSSDSTDTGDDVGKKISDMQISDEAWEGDHDSLSRSDSSPEENDWVKAFRRFKVQTDMIELPTSDKQPNTGSLDRRMAKSGGNKKERQKVRRNWSHSTSRGAISQNELRPYVLDRRQRRCASSSSARDINNMPLQDQLKTVMSPQPIQLHRVTLLKESAGEDFGFGVSDSVQSKGVYISAIRPGSVADVMGLKEFDRILQINKKRIRDYDCSAAIPLIADAGNCLDIVVCRNPLTQNNLVFKGPKSRKPLPEPPEDRKSNDRLSYDRKSSDWMSCDSENKSTDSIPVYMNVYSLDTPIARSEKSCKTV
ncbi:GRIP1-like protein [Mya arenaria]|uniref:GRIP1-like protein n=1 Tax=Mya arenaria TaxID=6604 RepID=A0ABY7FZD5_MYAAR|nr:glutamate receptor-interacting protein 2-like isoform X2 [Mya arenaria]WAR26106.1 GRIP1-like protein [Mya arenaria]